MTSMRGLDTNGIVHKHASRDSRWIWRCRSDAITQQWSVNRPVTCLWCLTDRVFKSSHRYP